MERVYRTEAIANFLRARTWADLASMYGPNMEVQVNVAQDGGERVEGEYLGRQWHGWKGPLGEVWKSFRIPRNANTEPEYVESYIGFDLDQHAEGVGMTGWDWQARCSRWVAFDFDAITGHADKHSAKLTETQLEEVKKAAWDIPWVSVRKSAGGRGLHLYIFLEPIPTSNHNEHSALARAILGKMSALTGFDFKSKVDICGHNMWVWHRKMQGTDGLSCLKQSTPMRSDDIPPNWKEHIKVIRGDKKRIIPKKIEESSKSEEEQLFLDLIGQRANIPLDDEHKRLLKYLLEDKKTASWWDADNHLLVTHTYHLKEAHSELGLKGVFETVAMGTERGNDINVFLFPLRRGSWALRRFSPGVQESPTWTQDGQGWTRCYYNQEPDLGSASRLMGGIESPSGGFVFREAESGIHAAEQLGLDVNLPNFAMGRETILKPHKDGRLIIQVRREDHDTAGEMSGWLPEKKYWTRIYSMQQAPPTELEHASYDDLLRHVVTETGSDYGWVLRSGVSWKTEPLVHVKSALKSLGINAKDTEGVIGASVMKCWSLVNRPFREEYPGDRQWNRDACQIRFTPTIYSDSLNYPTWSQVLQHCGCGLDSAIRENGWAKANGLKTGADYLKVWLSSLFKAPNEPLPYLFFYSKEQNTGKSTFHESVHLLMTGGVVRADNALISSSGFNAELKNSVMCVIEETDLRHNKIAAARIKDWVTSRHLPLHEKGHTPIMVPNTTHWVQCSNDFQACPIFPGDTRITMIHVPTIDPLEMIPKSELISKLEREATDFLSELLNLEIPPSNDRLHVPVIITEEKIAVEKSNRTTLEVFLEEHCHYVPGTFVRYSELWERFELYSSGDSKYWTQVRMGRELPPHYPKGRLPTEGSQWCIGNMSFAPPQNGDIRHAPYIAKYDGNNTTLVLEVMDTNADNQREIRQTP